MSHNRIAFFACGVELVINLKTAKALHLTPITLLGEASSEAPRVHHAAKLSMKTRDQDKEENQYNGEVPLPAVSANTLTRCLGVTPKIIYDLTKEGVIERGSGRLFQLEDSVRRYCEHLRRQTGGSC